MFTKVPKAWISFLILTEKTKHINYFLAEYLDRNDNTMNKIINGKKYSTDTATLIGSYDIW